MGERTFDKRKRKGRENSYETILLMKKADNIRPSVKPIKHSKLESWRVQVDSSLPIWGRSHPTKEDFNNAVFLDYPRRKINVTPR